jgi:hypothetical protein
MARSPDPGVKSWRRKSSPPALHIHVWINPRGDMFSVGRAAVTSLKASQPSHRTNYGTDTSAVFRWGNHTAGPDKPGFATPESLGSRVIRGREKSIILSSARRHFVTPADTTHVRCVRPLQPLGQGFRADSQLGQATPFYRTAI